MFSHSIIFSYSDFKERDRLDKSLSQRLVGFSETENVWGLADEDFEVLRKCVQNTRWATRDPFVVDFVKCFI